MMVTLATFIRNAYDGGRLGLTMSPRTLINWGRKTKRYSMQTAFNVAFTEKLTNEDANSVTELYVKVFGKE